MRFTAYAGASALLALGIVLRAFDERPNFYSATVYLAQSNACRMILLNLALLCAGGFMFGLQRLLYGPLRQTEIEQLWDKSWYAITETALAMTTFRDEVGGWFFLMFISLLAGKVWQWISEGRLEILEQQPPSNPRLFHIRLIVSLLLSEFFDAVMLRYCIRTLLEQPKPGMMVMFAFEFAVLTISSSSIAVRYFLSLHEAYVIKRQISSKLEERRYELRVEREQSLRQAGSGSDESSEMDVLGSAVNADIEEDDIDVPGWQEKGRWILFLDLATDFLKLLVYIGFFTILLIFYGIPIHILRDVFVTARSFVKRISDFIKYRNATRDMNTRYADATSAELEDNNTCIICREEMRVWQQPDLRPQVGARAQQGRQRPVVDERQRPKKLPCGHILHFSCLRSWLERQQVCPTCRSSVLGPATQRESRGQERNIENHEVLRNNLHRDEPGQGVQRHEAQLVQAPPGANNIRDQRARQNEARARTLTLGPWRVTFATGNEQQITNTLQRLRHQNVADTLDSEAGAISTDSSSSYPNNHSGEGAADSIQDHIHTVERQLMREIRSLDIAQEQLVFASALNGELARLRMLQLSLTQRSSQPSSNRQQSFSTRSENRPLPESFNLVDSQNTSIAQPLLQNQPILTSVQPSFLTQSYSLASRDGQASLTSGHAELPSGMTLPEGWSVLPLYGVELERQNRPTNTLNDLMPDSALDTESQSPSHESMIAARSLALETPSGNSSVPVTIQNQRDKGKSQESRSVDAARAPRTSSTEGSITGNYTSPSDSITDDSPQDASDRSKRPLNAEHTNKSGSSPAEEISHDNATAIEPARTRERSTGSIIVPSRQDKGKGKYTSPSIESASDEHEF